MENIINSIIGNPVESAVVLLLVLVVLVFTVLVIRDVSGGSADKALAPVPSTSVSVSNEPEDTRYKKRTRVRKEDKNRFARWRVVYTDGRKSTVVGKLPPSSLLKSYQEIK